MTTKNIESLFYKHFYLDKGLQMFDLYILDVKSIVIHFYWSSNEQREYIYIAEVSKKCSFI